MTVNPATQLQPRTCCNYLQRRMDDLLIITAVGSGLIISATCYANHAPIQGFLFAVTAVTAGVTLPIFKAAQVARRHIQP